MFFLLFRVGVVAGVPRFRVIPLGKGFHEGLFNVPFVIPVLVRLAAILSEANS